MELIVGGIIGAAVTFCVISIFTAGRDNELYMEGYLAAKYELPRDTNANKIRAMSDEELADAMLELGVDACEKIPFCVNSDKCNDIMDAGELIPEEMCKRCLIKWLKSEHR